LSIAVFFIFLTFNSAIFAFFRPSPLVSDFIAKVIFSFSTTLFFSFNFALLLPVFSFFQFTFEFISISTFKFSSFSIFISSLIHTFPYKLSPAIFPSSIALAQSDPFDSSVSELRTSLMTLIFHFMPSSSQFNF
jgi:hypothetical protein